MGLTVPCKDCADRTVECHADCSRYRQYAEACEQARKKRLQENDVMFSHPWQQRERPRWDKRK